MEVSEIKEFIDEQVKECEKELGENPFIVNKIIINKMYKFLDIKDMLDKLKPKAKWVKTNEWNNGYTEYSCEKCGHTKSVLDSYELPPYCESCGARMESEQWNHI